MQITLHKLSGVFAIIIPCATDLLQMGLRDLRQKERRL